MVAPCSTELPAWRRANRPAHSGFVLVGLVLGFPSLVLFGFVLLGLVV